MLQARTGGRSPAPSVTDIGHMRRVPKVGLVQMRSLIGVGVVVRLAVRSWTRVMGRPGVLGRTVGGGLMRQ
jgi:hypothetical protein